MKRIQRSQSEITQILNELVEGADIDQLIAHHGISKATIYRWRQKAQANESQKKKALKDTSVENTRLRKLLTDAALEIQALKEKLGELEN